MTTKLREGYLTLDDVESAATLYETLLDNQAALSQLGPDQYYRVLEALDDFGCAWSLGRALAEGEELIPFEQAMSEIDRPA